MPKFATSTNHQIHLNQDNPQQMSSNFMFNLTTSQQTYVTHQTVLNRSLCLNIPSLEAACPTSLLLNSFLLPKSSASFESIVAGEAPVAHQFNH